MAIIAEEKGERPEVVWTQLNTTPLSSNQSVRRIALMQHFAAQTLNLVGFPDHDDFTEPSTSDSITRGY
ncbi:MAG: hypothetical protein AAFP90_08945 [Planctomycetota bacterium]